MKRFLTTIALTCILSVSAWAGDMPTCGVMSPPPSGTTQTTGETTPGNVATDGLSEQESTNSALTVLLNILSLLAV